MRRIYSASGSVDALAPRAWAHGESHLGAGQIVGQVTRQIEVDVLSPALVPVMLIERPDDKCKTRLQPKYVCQTAMKG